MIELSTLYPKWIGLLRPNSGEGLAFNCPKCGPSHKLAVYFSNPVDGQKSAAWQEQKWNRKGDTFETLTIEPSIQYPCFHGWIECGKIIDVSESPAHAFAIVNGNLTPIALSPSQFLKFKNTEDQRLITPKETSHE